MAAQRGYEVVQEFTNRISRTKAKRPGNRSEMMRGARRSLDVFSYGLGVRSAHRTLNPPLPRCAG